MSNLTTKHPATFFTKALWLLLSLMLAAPAVTAEQKEVIRGIEFANVNSQPLLLDLYQAPNSSEALSPLIIWVHGGAWRKGNRKSVPLKALVQKGYTVASIDYRLTTIAPLPANIHDIKAAIRFLRANAGDYGINPTKIILAGESAGGHLAALAGLTNQNQKLEGHVGQHLQTSSEVHAIVSFFGAANLTTILSQSTPHGLSVRVPALKLLLNGSPEEKPELTKLASPVFHLDAQDPPTLLFHGDQDKQMPIEQSQELKQACDTAGVICDFHTLAGAGHGGKVFYDAKIIEKVDLFLQKQLKLKK